MQFFRTFGGGSQCTVSLNNIYLFYKRTHFFSEEQIPFPVVFLKVKMSVPQLIIHFHFFKITSLRLPKGENYPLCFIFS